MEVYVEEATTESECLKKIYKKYFEWLEKSVEKLKIVFLKSIFLNFNHC